MGIGSDQVEIKQGRDQGTPRAARAAVVESQRDKERERGETRQCQLRRDANMNTTWTGAVETSRVPVSRGEKAPRRLEGERAKLMLMLMLMLTQIRLLVLLMLDRKRARNGQEMSKRERLVNRAQKGTAYGL